MTTTAKIDHFHAWFTKIGGNMISKDPEKLINSLHNVPLQRASSLKVRSKEIKEKYNHKFKQNEHY